MMGFLKKILSKLVVWFILLVIFLLRWSCRRVRYGQHHIDQVHAEGRSVILLLWHEDFLAGILCFSFDGLIPIVSMSEDGDIATDVSTKLGFRPVRGSSSRGGKQAKAALISALMAQPEIGAITADGPKGPKRRLKRGIIDISRATGAPIVPLCFKADRFWRLKSWDQTLIPKPFANLEAHLGKPIVLDEAWEVEQCKEQLEKDMQDFRESVLGKMG